MTVAQIRELARREAEELLDYAWQPRVFPVDPIVIARKLGVSVFDAELGEDVWGMIVAEGNTSVIYLDQDQPEKRYRFTCAHELGHHRDRRDELVPGTAIVDRRTDAGRGSADEIYANEFAASLLMPASEFKEAVQEGLTDYEISDKFDTSVDSVRLRRMYLRDQL